MFYGFEAIVSTVIVSKEASGRKNMYLYDPRLRNGIIWNSQQLLSMYMLSCLLWL